MQPQRVLVLGTTVPVEAGDGTPAFVLDLSRHLGAVHDVTILAPRVPGAPRRSRLEGVVVERFAYFPRRWERLADGAILPNLRNEPWLALQVPFLMVALLLATLLRIRRLQPDLVHAHWFLPAGIVAGVCRSLTGVPYVVTGHGADVFALDGRFSNRLRALIAKRAAAVGATSEDLRRALGPLGDTPIFVAPMGVDVDQVGAAVGEREPEAGRLLFVGRLADKKGVDVVLRALPEVDGACLVVGGDGPDRPQLERIARKLKVDATFLGQIDRDRLATELRRAAALVVPSRIARDGDRDTTPLVMSEAMSAGVPVIASSLAGLAERIDDHRTGLLVPPEDVPSWVDALRWAVANPDELDRMGSRAQSEIRGSALDLRTTVTAYLDAFAAATPR